MSFRLLDRVDAVRRADLPKLLEKARGARYESGERARQIVKKVKLETTRYFDLLKLWTNNFSTEASRMLNQMTGYETCEKLKNQVLDADSRYRILKEDLQKSRKTFDTAIEARSKSQKELNALLQRKQAWLDDDLLRFTELYRQEMRLEQAELEARSRNESLDQEVDRAHQLLMDSIRERYQEEQLWSDKIRRISTFGTFSLMGLNLILFLLIQLYIEPRKRQQLLNNFELIVAEHIESATRDIKASSGFQLVPKNQKRNDEAIARTNGRFKVNYWEDFSKGACMTLGVGILWKVIDRFVG